MLIPSMSPILLLTIFISTIIFLIKTSYSRITNPSKNSPPSPPTLPILGNLHQLGNYPHRSLQQLAKRHGPLMLIHFGSCPVIIVSSADTAREIMRTHDAIFSSRPTLNPADKILYNKKNISTSTYGEYWRQVRSICVLHLLTPKRVKSFQHVRREETALLVHAIRRFSSLSLPVDMSDMFASITTNVISRVNFGKKFDDGEKRSKALTDELLRLFGGFNVGDYIPLLSWVGKVNGYDARVDRVAKELDSFLDEIVHEHVKNSSKVKGEDEKDLVDVLLEVQQDGKKKGSFSLDRDGVKALVMDMYVGGTDTTYTVLEWAMSELLRQPMILKKLQAEVDKVAAGKQDISESDLDEMPYLKSIIKETLRLYPPVPLIVPRESMQDCKVKGFDIAAGSRVIVGAWAIGRDPEFWNEPEKFDPERFMNSNTIDFKGNDNFQLIPFGAGRRGCPGVSFSMIVIEFVLATIVHKFDWALPGKMKDLDMTECVGFTIHRRAPLLAVATPRI